MGRAERDSRAVSAAAVMLRTIDVLVSVGFRQDRSEGMLGVCFDFGNFKLHALACINRRFREVVLLTGALSTPRTLTDVQEELPATVESREAALAFLTSALDRAAGGCFVPAISVGWLEEGRANKHLVSCDREQLEAQALGAAYSARPRCVVEREWMRVALKKLKKHLPDVNADSPVSISFDGEVLTFRSEKLLCVMPAEGEPWPTAVHVRAAALIDVPTRLREYVECAVWGSALVIERWSYPIEPEPIAALPAV